MARSRRKYRESRNKVRVGVPKKPKKLICKPVIVPGSEEVLSLKERTMVSSYKSAGILHNSNDFHSLDVPDEVMEQLEPDDVRSALGQKRKDGKNAGLQPLTTMQKVYISQLIKKYGDNFDAMSRDMKLNRMQHSLAALKKLCARFHAFSKLTENV